MRKNNLGGEKMTKVVLIGANHAGTAAANTILANAKDVELTIFDRNSNISYLGCGTALWVGKQIEGPEGLFYASKETFEEKGAKVYMETEIERIDFQSKIVFARGKDGQQIQASYDKLVLATGSLPIVPRIEGIGLENVHYVKLYQDGQAINAALEDSAVKKVAVVGAGYIGVELAEAIQRRGRQAMLFDVEATSLATYYDPWFTEGMDKVLSEHGIALNFGQKVQALKGANGKVSAIVTDKGEYAADLVILSIGFRPNTELGKNDLKLFANGAYEVNLKQETSLPGVYAIGDCATVYSNAVESPAYIALATNAVRSGVVAGYNVAGVALESGGVQGSNGISIFGYNMVSTGLSLKAAQKAGYDAIYTDWEDLQKPAFIANNGSVKIRIVYDKPSRRILGAQIASTENISMGIHMFSLAIEKKVTIDELKLLDIFFLPHFNQPYNYITMAALSAQ
jgi:NADPH-dependent 2,4-dienoyl-CoA reductase/sulfur reductase-like enzyme